MNGAITTKGRQCILLLPPSHHSKMFHLVLGKYYRADLNFPSTLPKRKDSVKHFEHDPPLSSCGVFQSRLIGKMDNILQQLLGLGSDLSASGRAHTGLVVEKLASSIVCGNHSGWTTAARTC